MHQPSGHRLWNVNSFRRKGYDFLQGDRSRYLDRHPALVKATLTIMLGILISIYQKLSSYTIPGPALAGIKKMARHAREFALDA